MTNNNNIEGLIDLSNHNRLSESSTCQIYRVCLVISSQTHPLIRMNSKEHYK